MGSLWLLVVVVVGSVGGGGDRRLVVGGIEGTGIDGYIGMLLHVAGESMSIVTWAPIFTQ